ncbi:MAG TPA: hypothetical protein VD770_01895 [Coxiellaceae bacterium]|nr:hypothetical protein [Coxiellaceae bacterium]
MFVPIIIFIRFALVSVLSAVVIFPAVALADLETPVTNCDGELERLETAFPLVPGISPEDGTKAFMYPSEDNGFASVQDSILTVNIELLFAPLNTGEIDASFIKFNALNSVCTAVTGNVMFGLNEGLNIVRFDLNTYELAINGNSLGILNPTGLIRYVWFDVVESYPTANHASYSYLIDTAAVQNSDVEPPVDDEEEQQGEEDGEPSEDTEPEEPEPQGKRPVLIIPGIMGTELLHEGQKIWLQPFNTSLIDTLGLNDDGVSLNDIQVGDVIDKISVGGVVDISIFDALLESLSADSFDYHFFSYDWRLNLDTNIILINNKIEEIKSITGFDTIDIVAHSMGGLVIKNYINVYGEDGVDKLIFIGTPHLGSPKAAKILLVGDKFSIPWLSASTIKEISLNSPAVYQLLPNEKYFEVFQGYIQQENIIGYSETKNYLLARGVNESMINLSEEFFAKELHEMQYDNIDVYNIAGCGYATKSAYKFPFNNSHVFKIATTTGDETVPFMSSAYIDVDFNNKFFVKASHAKLPSVLPVRTLILKILNDDFTGTIDISNSSAICNYKGKQLYWLSPVEVHVYDSFGNHFGPVENGFDFNIDGVQYEIIENKKFIFLPEGQDYTIRAIGEEVGSFDLLISEVDNGEVLNTVLYDDVQIQAGSKIEFIVSHSSADQTIKFAFNSDDEFEDLDYTIIYDGEIGPAVDQPEDVETPSDTSSTSGGFGGYSPALLEPEPHGAVLGENVMYFDNIKTGSLILDTWDNKTVYMVTGNKKYGFVSEEVFLNLGFSYANVKIGDLSRIEPGNLIETANIPHPEGSLIKQGDTIWLVKDGKRYGFPSMEVLNSYQIHINNLIDSNIYDSYLPEEVLVKKQ